MKTDTVIKKAFERMVYKPSELIKSFSLKPMPGRFFFRTIPREKLDLQKGQLHVLPGTKKGNNDVTEFERKFYDHPNQAVVISVGEDFDRGKEYKEKMVIKKGDIIYLGAGDARAVMYKGVAFMEGVQANVIAIAGNIGNDFTILDPEEDK